MLIIRVKNSQQVQIIFHTLQHPEETATTLSLQCAVYVYYNHLIYVFWVLVAIAVNNRNLELYDELLTSHGAHISGPDCEGQRGHRELTAGCSVTGCTTVRAGTGDHYLPGQSR